MTAAQTTDNRIYQAALSEFKKRDKSMIDKATAINGSWVIGLPFLIVLQARHETGNYTSNAFKKHNNCFGYAYVQGGAYQTGKTGLIADNGQPVADYATIEKSVAELVAWWFRKPARLETLRSVKDEIGYASALKFHGYYTDNEANYANGLQRAFDIVWSHKHLLLNAVAALPFFAIIASILTFICD